MHDVQTKDAQISCLEGQLSKSKQGYEKEITRANKLKVEYEREVIEKNKALDQLQQKDTGKFEFVEKGQTPHY